MEQKPAVTFKIFQLGDCETVLSELGMPASTNCHKQDMCPLIGMKHNRAVSKAMGNYINVVAPAAHLTFTGAFGDHVEGTNGGKMTNAEQGKYIIQFHVSDKAGNHE